MKELYNKQVFTELTERTATEHTALVVVDVQNDFCSEGGLINQLGGTLTLAKQMLPRLRALIEHARANAVKVVYIKNRNRPDGAYNSPSDLARRLETYAEEHNLLITLEGSWGEEVVAEVAPKPGEVIVYKHRPDAFERTDLDLVLRSNGVKSVVITGTATFACVESTARRALMKDYYVTVVEDCVSATEEDLHHASLKVMRAFFGSGCVRKSEEVLEVWNRALANAR